jgi:tetratricopeptide (TPR) repeat protein
MTISASWSKVPGLVGLLVAAVALTISAQEPAGAGEQLRTGDALLSSLRYEDAIAAYERARGSADPVIRVRAGSGMVRALLRMGQFAEAARAGAAIEARDPGRSAALAIHGDTLWASGRFSDAEARYAAALALDPVEAAALHGTGRSLAAQSRHDQALALVQRAVAADPREPAFLYTLASIHEARRDFAAAADALARYARLLPPSGQSHLSRWAEAQERFLRHFGDRPPFEVVDERQQYTVPLRFDGGRVLVDGSVNGRTAVAFALDTGTDQTILTPAVASRAGVETAVRLQTAGVGAMGLGFRDLDLARIDVLQVGDLRLRHVSAVIKSPALLGLPRPEGAGLSPLALGFSMIIDYGRRRMTMARELPPADWPVRLPLRIQRLPIVEGTVNGQVPASFAIDTAGDDNALSRSIAGQLDVDPAVRLVPARVYGSAGWDPTAFLLPFVDVDLAPGVRSSRSIVVLNLDAPSGLLGFELGGIIGHEFLKNFVVAIDLVRSELRLRPLD